MPKIIGQEFGLEFRSRRSTGGEWRPLLWTDYLGRPMAKPTTLKDAMKSVRVRCDEAWPGDVWFGDDMDREFRIVRYETIKTALAMNYKVPLNKKRAAADWLKHHPHSFSYDNTLHDPGVGTGDGP